MYLLFKVTAVYLYRFKLVCFIGTYNLLPILLSGLGALFGSDICMFFPSFAIKHTRKRGKLETRHDTRKGYVYTNVGREALIF